MPRHRPRPCVPRRQRAFYCAVRCRLESLARLWKAAVLPGLIHASGIGNPGPKADRRISTIAGHSSWPMGSARRCRCGAVSGIREQPGKCTGWQSWCHRGGDITGGEGLGGCVELAHRHSVQRRAPQADAANASRRQFRHCHHPRPRAQKHVHRFGATALATARIAATSGSPGA